jgi:hypothetical protein
MDKRYRTQFLLVIMTLIGFGCQEDTIEFTGQGIINGKVLDFETTQPISGAGITTTPPSSAILTDSAGNFRLENLRPSNYSISARKFGYQNSTVNVAVKSSETTEVVILLEKEEEQDE